jgi:hypothetical protein
MCEHISIIDEINNRLLACASAGVADANVQLLEKVRAQLEAEAAAREFRSYAGRRSKYPSHQECARCNRAREMDRLNARKAKQVKRDMKRRKTTGGRGIGNGSQHIPR